MTPFARIFAAGVAAEASLAGALAWWPLVWPAVAALAVAGGTLAAEVVRHNREEA